MGNTGVGGGGTTSGQQSRAANAFRNMLGVVREEKESKTKKKARKKAAKSAETARASKTGGDRG